MIYIFDNKQKIIKVLTNEDLTAGHLDLKINTATTFEFSLPANKPLPSNAKYVAVPHPLNSTKFILLRLTERTDNADTIDYSAYELAYQELATDGYIADKRPANQDALTLMKTALNGSNWELNNVNVAGTASTNFYYIDHLTAISKVVELLGGEIVFYVEIQGNTISGRYMDYLARQGEDTSKVFANGSNLLTIERQSDTSGIYTAILPRGKGIEIDGDNNESTPDGYGRRLNIADAVWKKSDGKPLNKPSGEIILYDPTANAEWGQIDGNYRLLLETYDDVDDVDMLINSAYKTLQSVNHPKIQYSATVADVGGLSLGDTVLIMHSDRKLSYKTRVFKVNYDLLDPEQTEISLGDDLSSNSITSQMNSVSSLQSVASEQTQWTINQVGRNPVTFGTVAPDNPKVGDTFFKYLPNGDTVVYEWNGEIWVEKVSSNTGEQIDLAVDSAIETAKSQAAEMDEVRASEAAVFQSEANAALSSAAAERADMFKQSTSMATSAATHADSMANSAAAYGKAQAASALSSANYALTTAKSDLTDDISVAKSEAIEAAKTADGVVKKQITDTADSINLTISQNKSDADGKIKTAQTAATQALDGLKAKVDQTTYDTKTGQLDKAVGSATLTADSAALSIKNYQSTVDGKFSSQAAAITANSKAIDTKVSQTNFDTVTGDLTTKYGNVKTTADAVTTEVTKYETANDKKVSENTASINALNNQITSKVNQTDFDKTTGDLSGKYSVQQQTINSISQTVTELQAKANAQGQVNQLMNTEFTPDLQGWITDSTDGSKVPYRSYARGGAGSITVGFNSTAARSGSTIRLIQTVILGSSTDRVVSLKWLVRTLQNNNYDNVRLLFRDSNNSDISDVYRSWADTSLDGTWHEIKWENITVPDNASTVNLYFQAREGTRAYLNKPMLVFANTIGDYVPGNYNNNARVTALELDVDGIHGLVDDPSKGLSATWNLASDGQSIAVQAKTAASTADGKAVAAQKDATTAITTANGTQTTVNHMQGDISDIQSTQTQTAGQVTAEIEDRKNGDKNTLTQANSFTSSQITSYDKGIQSQFTQQAKGIMASISTPNQLLNTEFNPDLEGWSCGTTGSTKAPYRSYWNTYNQATTVALNTTTGASTTYSRLAQNVQLASTTGTGNSISLSWSGRATQLDNYANLWANFYDASGNKVSGVNTKWVATADSSWNDSKWENISVPDTATSVRISFEAREGTIAYLSHPMLVFGPTIGPYMPGSYSGMNSSTVLQLFKDNWSIGLADNIGKITSGIIGDKNSLNLINNNIVLQGNTTVTADFYAKGGNFKNLNASNFTTGTINAAKINVINLDVSSLSGNITNFIKSYWNNAYSNVTIDGNGMSITAGKKRTDFKNGAINIQTQRGENLGFLGTTHLTKDDTVDFLTLALNGYHTTNPGDDHYDPSSKDFYGGDGFSFDVSGSNGQYEPIMRWNSKYAADIIGTHPGWQMLDHVFFEKGIFAHNARDNFKVSWTSWSDWGNYHNISLTNQNGSAGIAVNGDNLILFGNNKRTDGTKGWNV